MLIQDQIGWTDLDGDWLSFFRAISVDTIHLECRRAVAEAGLEIGDSSKLESMFTEAREKVEKAGLKLNRFGVAVVKAA